MGAESLRDILPELLAALRECEALLMEQTMQTVPKQEILAVYRTVSDARVKAEKFERTKAP